MMPEDILVYTAEELEAMRRAKALLLDDAFCRKNDRPTALSESEISPRHLAVTTVISKCRAEETAQKYLAWLKGFAYWDITEFSEEQLTDTRSDRYLINYRMAGRDVNGTRIFWIEGRGNVPDDREQERLSLMAGLRYHMAVHSDPKTLREGLTFVIDVTNKPREKIGNERRLQKSYNSLPLRPQHIFIVGARPLVRASINALLKVTGFVSKVKILKRIRFMTLEDIVDTAKGGSVPEGSLPKHLRGRSCGIEDLMANVEIAETDGEQKTDAEAIEDEQLVKWVNERIASLPVPDI